MRLEWIEDILAVYETGSLRAAASKRLLTASAFTRRIKAVEAAIGSDIFDRSKKPVVLRPHVAEMIPRLREAAAGMRDIQSDLLDTNPNSRAMRLICQHTVSVSWAPGIVSMFADDGHRTRIRSGSRDECGFSVLKNDSDIALIYDDPRDSIDQDSELFDRVKLGSEQFVPVIAYKKNGKLRPAIESNCIPLVVYPRTLFLGEMLEKIITRPLKMQFQFSTVAEAGLGPAVLELVREGLGVGWLPRSLISAKLETDELQIVDEILPGFCLDIIAIKSSNMRKKHVDRLWRKLEVQFNQRIVQNGSPHAFE